jgi:DNA-binding response OmpR family regulator
MERSAPPIVLIEDEEDDVQFVRRALRTRRIVNPVIVLPDVDTAKAYFRRSSVVAELPVLVILDIYLPRGGSGLDLLAWMRTQPDLAAVPVIVLSVSTDRTQEAQAFASQAAIVLRKAITPELLLDAIGALHIVETPTRSDAKKGIVLEPSRH